MWGRSVCVCSGGGYEAACIGCGARQCACSLGLGILACRRLQLPAGVHAAGQLVTIYPPVCWHELVCPSGPQVGVCGGGRQHPRRQHHACHLNHVGACRWLSLGLTVAVQCCGGACSPEPGRLAHFGRVQTLTAPCTPHLTHPPICRDVVTDTVHQFAPAYHDYVLYSDGTRKAVTPPTTVRTRTFVAGWSSWDGCGPS